MERIKVYLRSNVVARGLSNKHSEHETGRTALMYWSSVAIVLPLDSREPTIVTQLNREIAKVLSASLLPPPS